MIRLRSSAGQIILVFRTMNNVISMQFACYEKKMHLNMSSDEGVCCLKMLTSRTNFGILTNSVDPEQTAPAGAILSGSTLFATEAF